MKKGTSLWRVMITLLLVTALHPTGGGRLDPVRAGWQFSANTRSMAGAGETRHPPAVEYRSDPIRAGLLAIERETDPDRRSAALERVGESISDGDLRAVLDSLAPDASPGAAELRARLVRRWAERDAPAAGAWIAQSLGNPPCGAALEQVAIAWANSDLPAAVAWTQTLPDGDARRTATVGIAYEAARVQPVAALTLASGLSPTRERDDLLIHALHQWAATDFTSAAAWALQAPDPALRQRLIGAVAIAWAAQESVTAATLAVAAIVPGDEQDRAVISVVQRWAQHAPRAAASWVAQFPAPPLRDTAAQHLLSFWTARDAEAAGDWLLALPAGSLRNVGTSAYLRALADNRDRSK